MNLKKEKLSIIIPTFNAEEKLAEALDSIIFQTFTDFEIIVVDNLSKDNTINIIKLYASSYRCFKWISEKDKGIYDAMNKGIKMANGEWIYFLGSDDKLIDKHILKKIFNNEITNFDVIYGNVIGISFNGRYDGEFFVEKLINKNICHQAIFIRKNVFERIGYFNVKYLSYADWDHNLRWFLNLRIKKKYINLDIAEYGADGFSSVVGDAIFANEKKLQIIKYGLFRLSSKLLYELALDEYKRAKKEKKIFRKIILKIIKNYAILCLKFQ